MYLYIGAQEAVQLALPLLLSTNVVLIDFNI